MATRREKTFSSIVGAIIGGVLGYSTAKKNNVPPKDRWKHILGGVALGGSTGYVLADIFGTPNDTVNYELMQDGSLVYHGITYEHRIDRRESEHIKSGKVFDEMIYSSAKPRVDAARIEVKRIKRDKPKYNIQHNN